MGLNLVRFDARSGPLPPVDFSRGRLHRIKGHHTFRFLAIVMVVLTPSLFPRCWPMPFDRQRSVLGIRMLLFEFFVTEPTIRSVDALNVLLFVGEEQRLLMHNDSIWINIK